MSPGDKITPDDLLDAMAAADVLDLFSLLPEDAKQEFQAWIGKARDEEAHWRRIDTLVLAMRAAPRLEAERIAEPAAASEPDQHL